LIHEFSTNMDLAIVDRVVDWSSALWDNIERSDGMTPLIANEGFRHLESTGMSWVRLSSSWSDASYR
jgi:hypothetical protein